MYVMMMIIRDSIILIVLVKDQDDGRLLEEGDILILEKGEGRDK